jgi:hypothetical protein
LEHHPFNVRTAESRSYAVLASSSWKSGLAIRLCRLGACGRTRAAPTTSDDAEFPTSLLTRTLDAAVTHEGGAEARACLNRKSSGAEASNTLSALTVTRQVSTCAGFGPPRRCPARIQSSYRIIRLNNAKPVTTRRPLLPDRQCGAYVGHVGSTVRWRSGRTQLPVNQLVHGKAIQTGFIT